MNKKSFPLILLGVDAYVRFSKPLIDLGFIPIILPRDERLPLPVSSHADMLVFIVDNVIFCNEKYYYDKGAWLACAFPHTKHLVKWYFIRQGKRRCPAGRGYIRREINRGIKGFAQKRGYADN